MKRAGLIASLAGLAMTGMAAAAEVAPNDVKFEDNVVAAPLTDTAGNAEEGAKVAADRGLGNCITCHAVSALKKEQFHGDVAPPLDGAADRWTPEELRAIIVDSKKVFGDQTVMPGFYSLDVGIDVRKDLVGKTILTAQQVEDVVAFIATLKE